MSEPIILIDPSLKNRVKITTPQGHEYTLIVIKETGAIELHASTYGEEFQIVPKASNVISVKYNP